MVSQVHASHLGIEACLRKGRDVVYWPAMSGEIEDAVGKCTVCAESQSSNAKQSIQSHWVPDRPWSSFTLLSREYVVLVAYFSDFVKVRELGDTTTTAFLDFLKEQFSRHVIPDTLVSNNGPQFVSRHFAEFAREGEFQHVTSSPYRPQSNGKAESAVKVSRIFS